MNDGDEEIEIEDVDQDEFNDLLDEFILQNKDKYGEDLKRKVGDVEEK